MAQYFQTHYFTYLQAVASFNQQSLLSLFLLLEWQVSLITNSIPGITYVGTSPIPCISYVETKPITCIGYVEQNLFQSKDMLSKTYSWHRLC